MGYNIKRSDLMEIKISDKAKEQMAKDFKTDSDENYIRIHVKSIN